MSTWWSIGFDNNMVVPFLCSWLTPSIHLAGLINWLVAATSDWHGDWRGGGGEVAVIFQCKVCNYLPFSWRRFLLRSAIDDFTGSCNNIPEYAIHVGPTLAFLMSVVSRLFEMLLLPPLNKNGTHWVHFGRVLRERFAVSCRLETRRWPSLLIRSQFVHANWGETLPKPS